MDSWIQVLFSTIFVTFVIYFFNFDAISGVAPRIFSYMGVAFIPVTSIQVWLAKRDKINIEPSEFMFSVFLNCCMVLTFSLLAVMLILKPILGD